MAWICQVCGVAVNKPIVCTRCAAMVYCSSQHAALHYSRMGHKEECSRCEISPTHHAIFRGQHWQLLAMPRVGVVSSAGSSCGTHHTVGTKTQRTCSEGTRGDVPDNVTVQHHELCYLCTFPCIASRNMVNAVTQLQDVPEGG